MNSAYRKAKRQIKRKEDKILKKIEAEREENKKK